jgi:hypothetical protein
MNTLMINENSIKDKIYTIRNLQVMLDRDLATLYGVETKHINQAVRNNQDKFMDDFYFELTNNEFEDLRSNFLTTNFAKTRTNPKVFTEQGIYMLATILKSKVASQVTVYIIKTFANMRKLIYQNISMFERFERIENRLTIHDRNFDKLFEALEDKTLKQSQGIFYDGQIYDAYSFASDLIKTAKNEIILIDNYIDDTVLTIFSKIPNIRVTIYTNAIPKQLKLDFEKYQKQYQNVEIRIFKNSHDRFIILDKKEVYHLGASLKDLAKKWFVLILAGLHAFSKMNFEPNELIAKMS